MRVVLSDPSLVDELVGQLRTFRLQAERDGDDAVRVTMPPPATNEPENAPNQEKAELTFVVRTLLLDYPHASFTVE